MTIARTKEKIKVAILDKMLDNFILEQKHELIYKGIEKCRNLLGKQKSGDMYFFYEGSIEGFMECLSMNSSSDYETRLKELREEEIREISKSSLRNNTEERRHLRERLMIYKNDEEIDMDEVFKIKGRRTQIRFVYDRITALELILNNKKISIT